MEKYYTIMDNEHINVTIAEWMGYRVFRPSEIKMRGKYDEERYGADTGLYILPKKKRPQTHMIDARPLPRFTESLDLLYQAEKKAIEQFLGTVWWNSLVRSVGSARCSDVASASAEHRALALYRLIKNELPTTVSQHTAKESMKGITLTN